MFLSHLFYFSIANSPFLIFSTLSALFFIFILVSIIFFRSFVAGVGGYSFLTKFLFPRNFSVVFSFFAQFICGFPQCFKIEVIFRFLLDLAAFFSYSDPPLRFPDFLLFILLEIIFPFFVCNCFWILTFSVS
jgi:hypothetical protein